MLLRLLVVSKFGDNFRQTHLGAAPSGLPESNLTPQPPGFLPWSRRSFFGHPFGISYESTKYALWYEVDSTSHCNGFTMDRTREM